MSAKIDFKRNSVTILTVVVMMTTMAEDEHTSANCGSKCARVHKGRTVELQSRAAAATLGSINLGWVM